MFNYRGEPNWHTGVQYGTSGGTAGDGTSLPLIFLYSAEIVVEWRANLCSEASVTGAKTTHLFHVMLGIEKNLCFYDRTMLCLNCSIIKIYLIYTG